MDTALATSGRHYIWIGWIQEHFDMPIQGEFPDGSHKISSSQTIPALVSPPRRALEKKSILLKKLKFRAKQQNLHEHSQTPH